MVYVTNELPLTLLERMGHSSAPIRYYLWFQHFLELRRFDHAEWFLRKLVRYDCDLPDGYPQTRTELNNEFEAAQAKGLQ